jgi:hypothetical protein
MFFVFLQEKMKINVRTIRSVVPLVTSPISSGGLLRSELLPWSRPQDPLNWQITSSLWHSAQQPQKGFLLLGWKGGKLFS